MRWHWIDRYTEFVSGQRATAVKNVTLADEQLHDHFEGWPLLPNALVVEGMAQTAGLLVSEHYDFEERVILAKLSRCTFYGNAAPGERLTYRAAIHQIKRDGAMVSTTSHIGERLQAEADIYFAHLADRSGDQMLYEKAKFVQWLDVLQVFKIGVKPDGSPITAPAS